MIRVKNIKIHYGEDKNNILKKAVKKLGVSADNVTDWKIYKESLDVRKKDDIFYIYTVDLWIKNEDRVLSLCKSKDVEKAEVVKYKYPESTGAEDKKIAVIGFGPAGMFSALLLSQMGFKVTVFERGKDVEGRMEDINVLMEKGILNKNSNIQFGEGGAGTFSDGKLTTRIKDPRCKKVMEEFVSHGAPEEIMYVYNPHIGTDRLVDVVRNIREDIISLGGEVRFESCVTDIKTNNGHISSIRINDEYDFECSDVILAVGHSARDTFEMLYSKNIDLRQKPFAIGARIEHPQEVINKAQFGEDKKAEYFGPAEYKLTHTAKNGRGVYTFCMCPGGHVVPAASEENMTAVNGMSYYARDGKNANSALLVQVFPEDFKTDHPLGGMYMQREIEKKAFEMAGGGYKAPAQSVGSFIGKESGKYIETSYRPDIKMCLLDNLFEGYITDAMREGIVAMGRKVKGFDNPDALLIAPETRSSSPVRIERDKDTFECTSIKGFYPCGEGAGYAGGIVSAAVDGIRIAEIIAKK